MINKLPTELRGMRIAPGIFIMLLRILVDKRIITEAESVKYWKEYQPTFFPRGDIDK